MLKFTTNTINGSKRVYEWGLVVGGWKYAKSAFILEPPVRRDSETVTLNRYASTKIRVKQSQNHHSGYTQREIYCSFSFNLFFMNYYQ